MSLPFKSQQDLYNMFIGILQGNAPQLTDIFDGSTIDALAGVFSVAGIELQRYNLIQFNKCFFDLANGPEITQGPDDLQTLAVDHFGDAFARPGAVSAIDVATFARPNNALGAIPIGIGSIVKTQPDANGNTQRYSTNAAVMMTNTGAPTDLSVSVPITAVVAGAAGDANAGTINVIETALLDPTITVTNAGNATGEDAQDDATYRETIRNLITALRAATKAAIESAALSVSGVVIATAIEIEDPVLFWNPETNAPQNAAIMGIFEYFLIPFVTLYIADSTGSASGALIAAVNAAVDPVRAFGVNVNVVAATPIIINWSASLGLNPAGPNYGTFSSDPSEIVASMTNYIASLGAGVSFIRATANAAILAIWGPTGTNDLTTFVTTIPVGDVAISANQSAIPGVVNTV